MTMTPDAVRDVNAHFYGGEHYIGRRLLDDPNMGQVWLALMSEGNDHNPQSLEGRLDSLDGLYRMETWGAPTYGVSLADQACASFFLATSIVFGVGNHVVTESSIQRIDALAGRGSSMPRGARFSAWGMR
jgi:hypothetical protein